MAHAASAGTEESNERLGHMERSMKRRWLTLSIVIVSTFCARSRAQLADTIYHGGDIVTVDDKHPSAEALAVKDGNILAVGNKDEVFKTKGPATRLYDLQGKTLVPGFVDGHSHFINCVQMAQQANCFAPPRGPCQSIKDIIAALASHQRKFNIPKGEFIIGYGFDETKVSDHRDLTAADLDATFPDNPVAVIHFTQHGGICNSAALRKLNLTKDTPTPKGGVIVRVPGTTEPAGRLMETAWIPVFTNLPKPNSEELLKTYHEAEKIYTSAGITTAQEGATTAHDVELLRAAADQGLMSIDVVSYPFITEAQAVLKKHPPETFGSYHHHLKLGGIKITTDGSPQARTAFFTTPYLTGGPSGETGWRGEPSFPQAELNTFVKFVYDRRLQLIVHCNGDAAIDMLLDAHKSAASDPSADRRTVVIHSQFVRKDQLARYVDYNLVASFFTEHCYYFGEAHTRNRGREQAAFLSPMKSALTHGLRCANHTDFNVLPIDQIFTMWCAVNRLTEAGDVLGADERITPLQALKAITLDGAYLYREETTKGSLEVGKLADLVVLDKNPLTVAPIDIKQIKVIETIKEGKTVYAAN
jgi:predicted amidohydrolase YtcJ